MGKWGTGKILKNCEHCKIQFYARHDRLGKYCSKSCSSSHTPKRYLRVKKNCKVCGVEYEIKRYRINTSLYCSIQCRKKQMPSKEKHPNWKGGISNRTYESKKIIKKLILEVGKCEECGVLENLQGHHKIPYSENKELREDINNIQVLCVLCHSNKHPMHSNFILKGIYHGKKI